MRIVYCGTGWLPVVDRIRSRLPPGLWVRARDLSKTLADSVATADVIIPSNAPIDGEVIAAAKNVRLVQQLAAGYESIDLEAAKAAGIPVCNVPGMNAPSVAETALMLILALAKRMPVAARMLREGKIGEPIGIELEGKTLGIVGLGRSGTRLSKAAAALGMNVLSTRSGSGRGELDRLLAFSDVVSLHCPLDATTRNLIDARALGLLKKGALLVNCARGGVVDRDALVAALDSGQLGGYGLDVHWEEPIDPGDTFYLREDIVALPHIAGSTEESFARAIDVLLENVSRVIAGKELLNRIA